MRNTGWEACGGVLSSRYDLGIVITNTLHLHLATQGQEIKRKKMMGAVPEGRWQEWHEEMQVGV